MKQSNVILVTGIPRSGSTWVGHILAKSGNTYYMHEPFHPRRNHANLPAKNFFDYIKPEVKSELRDNYEDYIKNVLKFNIAPFGDVGSYKNSRKFKSLLLLLLKIRNAIYPYQFLIKDPPILFSVEWMYKFLGCKIIVVIRHPAAFCYSIKKAKWGRFGMDTFINQKLLMKDYLSGFTSELQNDSEVNTELENHVLFWRISHHMIKKFAEKYDNWVFIKHEDLSSDPENKFEDLYDKLNLKSDDKIRNYIKKNTHSKVESRLIRNSEKTANEWKNGLSLKEIELIKSKSSDVWPYFYTENDW